MQICSSLDLLSFHSVLDHCLFFFFFHQQLAYVVQDFNLLTLYRRAAECIDAEL